MKIYENHNLVKQLKRNVFLIESNDVYFVLKKLKKSSNIIDLMNKRNKANFKRELFVIKSLASDVAKSFRVPKLIETDNKTYFILEYIDSFSNNHIIYNQRVINAIVDFNNHILLHMKISKYRNMFLFTLFSILSTKKLLKIQEKLSLILNLIMINFKIKKGRSRLIHGDLRRGYNLNNYGSTTTIIDFESSFIERKFTLYDIVNSSNDPKNKKFFKKNVLIYIKQNQITTKYNDIMLISYVCLIRSLLVNLNSFDNDTSSIISIVREHFLDINLFTHWFQSNNEILSF